MSGKMFFYKKQNAISTTIHCHKKS